MSLDKLSEAISVMYAYDTLSEAKQKQKKGVDAELQRAAKRGWIHNPWHGRDGKFTSRDSAKSASTSSPQSGGEHPKYRDKMAGGKPGKKVAQVCGRHAREKGLDLRCQDKSAKK